MKTTVHIISHAHWDREWYMPLEIHRARLIDQLDNVLELLEKYPDYTYHLDGQMIALEDYLLIRPEKAAAIRRFVNEGRLHIGPWYVLQDEFLTSSEANVRNLLHGMAMAKEIGKVCLIGYLPDAFGNTSQMPQLFKQAGMKAAAFGRGVSLQPEAPSPEDHFPACSEFNWQSPDGSFVPAIFFSGWYNNAQEIPVDPETAKPYWDERLAHAKRFAASEHLLFLNGADHQPVQKNLPKALETARKLYPEIDFIQSDFEQFIESVRKSRGTLPETVSGELAGQESDGTNTLCNTASSRIPLKVLNRRTESLLAMTTEPLLAMASFAGMKMDTALLKRAWKLLMQNHPHDSICCCGIDEVHREMKYRYEKSIQLGELLAKRAGLFLAGQIQAPALESSVAAFAVINPTGWAGSRVITAEISVDREYGTREARKSLLPKKPGSYHLTDHNGNEIPAKIGEEEIRFGYELPDDTFRKPYFERRIRVTFSAENLPAFGWNTFYLKSGPQLIEVGNTLRTDENRMENRYIAVDLHPDGTFDIQEKHGGRVYRRLGEFEDVGDVGNEYVFSQALGDPVTGQGSNAEIICIEDTAVRTSFKIEKTLYIPESADIALEEAHEAMIRHLTRRIGRSKVMVPLCITTTVTLEKDSPVLKVRTEFNNTAKDHRLRMLFPTDLSGTTHLADSVFDVVERPDVPGPNWTNPSRCQRMQYFAAVQDENGGLAVINRGAYEYEILQQRKQIAVTILRSVGEMGDWGVFPTPDAQCLEPITMELGIYAYPENVFCESGFREAYQFQTEFSVLPVEQAEGELPEHGSLLKSEGTGLAVTSLKPSEDEKSVIIRAVNLSEQSSEWQLSIGSGRTCFDSDITEQKGSQLLTNDKGFFHTPMRKKEITTLRIETN